MQTVQYNEQPNKYGRPDLLTYLRMQPKMCVAPVMTFRQCFNETVAALQLPTYVVHSERERAHNTPIFSRVPNSVYYRIVSYLPTSSDLND